MNEQDKRLHQDSQALSSKFTVPIRQRSYLTRDELAPKLEKILHARAAVIHAPAGFGKTSLLASWVQDLSSQEIPIAWLSLDDHDRDQVQFLNGLTNACKVGALIGSTGVLSTSSNMSGSPPRAIVSALLTELNKCTGSQVLILDDFHRAETDDNCDVINQLLDSFPEDIHLVISSRELPRMLALANHRVHDELVEIDHMDLRFNEREIQQFLGTLINIPEQPTWLQDLSAKTEGWPIALQIVRRWILEGVTLEETLDQLSGRSSDLSDYFLEEVFDNLSEAVQAFLLRTSILERVTGDLANLLCETNAAWKILEDLERRDVFVQCLDRERTWYRYHRLFSEFLQERLRRRFGDITPELHQIASTWFLEHGHMTEAVQHAIASGCSSVAAQLFEKLGGWHYILQGHASTIERALSFIKQEDIIHCPRLWLGKVFVTVRRGDIEQAESMFDDLSKFVQQLENEDPQLENELQILYSIMNLYADKSVTDTEIQRLEDLSGLLPHENHAMHAVRCNILCTIYARQGRFNECMIAGDRAIRHFRAMGSVWGETYIYFHEGYACMAQGRLRDGEVLYKAGYDLAVENFGKTGDLTAIANVFLAEAAYERNSIHEASQLLELSLSHIEQFDAWLEVYVAAYTTVLKLARVSQDKDLFTEVLNRARATAKNRRLPRLRKIVEMQALEYRQRDRNDCKGEELYMHLDGPTESLDHPVLWQLHTSVAARIHVEAGQSHLAIELLQEACREAYGNRLIRNFKTLSVLLATILWDTDQHEEAVNAFEAALSPSLFEGTRRIFIDEGGSLMNIICDLAQASEKQRGNRLRDRFLAELIMEINAGRVQVTKDIDELSPREQEVLRYLAQGRSNREIAEMLQISINTVKFHLKNIFDKLHVTTRKDAVSASAKRSLLL